MRFLRTFHVAAAVNRFAIASSLGHLHERQRCFQSFLGEGGRCVSNSTPSSDTPPSSSAKQRANVEEIMAARAPLRRPPSAADAIPESLDEEHRHGEYRKAYSKVGYDFVENIRTSHPNFIINQTRVSLLFYSVAACTVFMYVVYYFTTYTYVLTNNPKPFINSMFQHYPCDYAIIENRWTGHKTVVEVEPLERKERTGGSYATSDCVPTSKTIYINSLLDRIFLYVQKSRCVVQWDASKELVPDRFISKKLLHNVASENFYSSRATVAVRRRDQLLESPANDRTPKQTLLGRLFTGNKPNAIQEKQEQEKSTTAAARSSKMPRLLVTSTVRAQDKTNGDVQGDLPAYEEMIKTTLHDLLVSRYYECILRQKVQPGVSPVFAREMVANGTVDGTGVRWEDVVPSFEALESEVQQKMETMVGNDILIYDFHISCLFK